MDELLELRRNSDILYGKARRARSVNALEGYIKKMTAMDARAKVLAQAEVGYDTEEEAEQEARLVHANLVDIDGVLIW